MNDPQDLLLNHHLSNDVMSTKTMDLISTPPQSNNKSSNTIANNDVIPKMLDVGEEEEEEELQSSPFLKSRSSLDVDGQVAGETYLSSNDDNLWSQFRGSVNVMLFQSYWNVMLLFGPFAMLLHGAGISDSFVFALAGLTLIPLAERLSYITECIADQTNETLGALINATFGNAPELLISISALNSEYYRMIQLTLLGSMLTNMLFVFGAACLVGGIRWKQQTLEKTASASGNVYVGLLLLSVAQFLIPSALEVEETESAYQEISQSQQEKSNDLDTRAHHDIRFDQVRLSRIVATVTLISYVGYIFLTLCTHHDEFEEEYEDEDDERLLMPKKIPEASPIYIWYCNHFSTIDHNDYDLSTNQANSVLQSWDTEDDAEMDRLQPQSVPELLRPTFRKNTDNSASLTPLSLPVMNSIKKKYSDGKPPMTCHSNSPGAVGIVNGIVHRIRSPNYLNHGHEIGNTIPLKIAGIWLLLTTLCVNIISDTLVDTIESFASAYEINAVFIAAIILPILSNIAEMASAVIFAYRNKMDLCLGVTVGSAIQIALFVFPCSILFGWVTRRPMRIFTQSFETACLFIGVLMTAGILQGTTTNWFVGMFLIMTYIIVASGFAFHHIDDLTGT